MAKFLLTQLAENDFDDIGAYTQDVWGENQAEKYLIELNSVFIKLVEHQGFGRDRSDLAQDLLSFPCNEHMIFFRRDGEGNVEVLRILGQSMDFDRHF